MQVLAKVKDRRAITSARLSLCVVRCVFIRTFVVCEHYSRSGCGRQRNLGRKDGERHGGVARCNLRFLRNYSGKFTYMVEFICWVAVIALAAAFILSLAVKWHILEWLQVHAPNEFLNELFSCNFCCSWWVCAGISLILFLARGWWPLLFAPICSTIICRELWRH